MNSVLEKIKGSWKCNVLMILDSVGDSTDDEWTTNAGVICDDEWEMYNEVYRAATHGAPLSDWAAEAFVQAFEEAQEGNPEKLKKLFPPPQSAKQYDMHKKRKNSLLIYLELLEEAFPSSVEKRTAALMEGSLKGAENSLKPNRSNSESLWEIVGARYGIGASDLENKVIPEAKEYVKQCLKDSRVREELEDLKK